MGTVLFAWELGGGLGHLMQIKPLAQGLRSRGHRVVVAMKHLSRADSVLGREGVLFLQSPVKNLPEPRPIQPPAIFAHLLHNVGYSSERELWTLSEAWRNLYDFIKPDLIVFDHAPTALLAARGFHARKVVIGSGFCIPVDQSPLPNLRPWIKADPWQLRVDEQAVLDRMNQVLIERKQPPLDRITRMYAEVDETLLLTYRELDHYPWRKDGRYWGAWTNNPGQAPEWPKGSGRRIYAYLKDFPAASELLGALKELGNPAIVLVDGISRAIQDQYRCENIAYQTEPLDMQAVGKECDLGILNAGHGTTAAMLLAGRAILQLPIYLEQAMLANATRRMGAAQCASTKDGPAVARKLHEMLGADRYAEAARAFAAKQAGYDPPRRNEQMLARLESLIAA